MGHEHMTLGRLRDLVARMGDAPDETEVKVFMCQQGRRKGREEYETPMAWFSRHRVATRR